MRYLQIIPVIIAALLLAAGCSKQKDTNVKHGYVVVDDIGDSVAFNAAPQRVITLAPSMTEMIYAIGAEKYLVGNTLYCDYPEAAKKITKVGDILTFDYEKILSLKPDIIFLTVEGNQKDTYDKFRELGLKLFVSNPRNFAGIKKTFLDMGVVFQKEDTAKSIVAGWDSTVAKVKDETKNLDTKTMMLIVDLNPLILAGKNTFINELIEMCGMKNIAAGAPSNYPQFSREQIVKLNPDFIIYPASENTKLSNVLSVYPEWKELKAVKNDQLIFVDRNLYSRPGPRFVAALEDLFRKTVGRQDHHHSDSK